MDNAPPIQYGGLSEHQIQRQRISYHRCRNCQTPGQRGCCGVSSFRGRFYLSCFLRLKKNGIDYRMILNLKELNKFVAYQHFKMDSLKCVTSLMTQGCYMASVDTRDAYYTVPVALEHQKYLKFTWRDKLYQYTCLTNGLASAPRIFTKLLKTVFKVLRQKRPFIFVINAYR